MKIYSIADNIISPLGLTTEENIKALSQKQSGIAKIAGGEHYPEDFYGAGIDRQKIDEKFDQEGTDYTFLEKLFILSISNVLDAVPNIDKKRLVLIISTTKGNIDLLNENPLKDNERLVISHMANIINQHFQLPHAPIVVSNACISGVSALLIGKKLIEMGQYDHVLVAGGDIMSEFTIAGFQCLKAISEQPCRPYDEARTGVTLGEACGTVLLSNNKDLCPDGNALSILAGGGQSNDANHISGPSRTGKGLKIAIEKALKQANIDYKAVGYINAHGTATLFNDEMEAIAFDDLGMSNIPLNSLKGYFGHTLGAAGVIETILSIRQANLRLLFPTLGYEERGVSRPINILSESLQVPSLPYVLKTASGFGGCNAALVIKPGK